MGIWRERRDVHNSIFVVDKLAPCIINGLPVQGDFPDRGNVCEADKGVPACGAGAARECATGGLSTDSWHFFTFSCNNPSTAVRRSPAPYTGAAENCAHFYQLLSRESTSGPPSTGNSLSPHLVVADCISVGTTFQGNIIPLSFRRSSSFAKSAASQPLFARLGFLKVVEP